MSGLVTQTTTRRKSWVGRLASVSAKPVRSRIEQVCSGIGGAIQDCAFGLSHLATTTSLMEARVTTATRRLRRSAVATLAATVTAGVAILATSTSAFAAFGTVT